MTRREIPGADFIQGDMPLHSLCISLGWRLTILTGILIRTRSKEFHMRSLNLKILSVGVLLFLAILACGPVTTLTPTPTASPVPATLTPSPVPPTATPTVLSLSVASSPAIHFLDMLDVNNGWALNDSNVMRTIDGGGTWYNATPVGVSSTSTTFFFMNNTTGWVLLPGSDPTSGTLYHTTDGGTNWTSNLVPFSDGSMQFIDPNNGWILVGLGGGMSHEAVAVFRTSDGGATWSQVFTDDPTAPVTSDSLPFVGDKTGLTALDATHAWVTGAEPVSDFIYFYTTQDGGQTWSAQNPSLPAGYAGAMTNAFPPSFFSATEGVLPVGVYADTSATILYLSHDGGQTWAASLPVAISGHVSLISQMDFFVWDGGSTLYASQNAGTSWTPVTTNVNIKDTLVSFQFVNATTGWAVTGDASNHYSLYKTTDGGATWNLLIP
jgi:photosystem II stability/assembly factor-like uncharacterized protein